MVEASKEQYRFNVITKVINKEIKPGVAAKLLGISTRQLRRLRIAVLDNGKDAVIHGLKGKPSNHKYKEEEKVKVIETIKEKYSDFKPKFATEKLQETQGITMTSQTIRIWMTEAGLWESRKQKPSTYFAWRPRREYFGELQQFDGSYHYWFENRFLDSEGNPIEVCLLASIDDATGKITRAEFAAHEGVIPVFNFWRGYILEIGKPLSIYLDKFSTYKINHKNAVDNSELLTQFQQATRSLNIELIPANSPQAKGRIERLFGTLQDRLVKEMRLAKVSNPMEGNIFLKDVFIPKFNKQFSVTPAKEGNVHRLVLSEKKEQLNHIFSIHHTRRVNHDFTIQFKNQWYQLTEIQPTTVRPIMIILVETWLDSSIHLILKNHELNYIVLPEKPKKQRIKQPVILTTHTLNYRPPANHPWRLARRAAIELKRIRG